MTKEELRQKLELHLKWLGNEAKGVRADLCGANLRRADLCGADLRRADLRGADLCGANLCGADLCGANLCGANLRRADLRGADLCGADLCGADLRRADLCGADLREADLRGADLDEKEKVRKGIYLTKPLKGWKKCRKGEIVELLIPKGAVVFSINNKKCRTNKAKVLSVDGHKTKGMRAESNYSIDFIYEVGKTIEVVDFDCQYNEECAEGIHFFRTKEEAEEYSL